MGEVSEPHQDRLDAEWANGFLNRSTVRVSGVDPDCAVVRVPAVDHAGVRDRDRVIRVLRYST